MRDKVWGGRRGERERVCKRERKRERERDEIENNTISSLQPSLQTTHCSTSERLWCWLVIASFHLERPTTCARRSDMVVWMESSCGRRSCMVA